MCMCIRVLYLWCLCWLAHEDEYKRDLNAFTVDAMHTMSAFVIRQQLQLFLCWPLTHHSCVCTAASQGPRVQPTLQESAPVELGDHKHKRKLLIQSVEPHPPLPPSSPFPLSLPPLPSPSPSPLPPPFSPPPSSTTMPCCTYTGELLVVFILIQVFGKAKVSNL